VTPGLLSTKVPEQHWRRIRSRQGLGPSLREEFLREGERGLVRLCFGVQGHFGDTRAEVAEVLGVQLASTPALWCGMVGRFRLDDGSALGGTDYPDWLAHLVTDLFEPACLLGGDGRVHEGPQDLGYYWLLLNKPPSLRGERAAR
jgi:hypothetical protein